MDKFIQILLGVVLLLSISFLIGLAAFNHKINADWMREQKAACSEKGGVYIYTQMIQGCVYTEREQPE